MTKNNMLTWDVGGEKWGEEENSRGVFESLAQA